MAIVSLSTTLIVALSGYLIKTSINFQYLVSGDLAYNNLYYFFAEYQIVIYFFAVTIAIILFSSWILAPSVNEITKIIKDYIDIEKDIKKVELPKGMVSLQEALIQINKDILLWKQAAKEAERKKDELVVYLAHDIRTPLASILGYLSLLEDRADLTPEQQQKFIKIVTTKAESIQSLVEELFEITRYNISQIELLKENVDIIILLQQLVEELALETASRNIRIQLEYQGGFKAFADAQKLGRVIENILINAIRYSPNGEVINISITEESKMIKITFTNKGVEMNNEELERLFKKFYRGDQSRQTSTGGSGLGLAIAKNIIEAHKGKIYAQAGERSISFILELPKALESLTNDEKTI